MTLERDDATPGLWIDPQLAGRSATHAIVIGISAYPHLKGGTGAPADDHFGLGQLAVSAQTAFRFFEWLRDDYHHETAPIGSVRLLLSPTAEERAENAGMEEAGAYAPADYATCEAALIEWRRRLATLAPDIAAASRSIFFFSGHGLEINQLMQILLPSDYLDPQKPSLNRALSTLNLKHGMLSLAVQYQFFFIDACRNGGGQLGGAVVEGSKIFDVYSTDKNNPDVNSALMYGTASGAQSWQPAAAAGGQLSLFGDALLEAVSGGAPFNTETPPAVQFDAIASFTNQQVANLLRQRGAQVRQAIKGELSFVGVVHQRMPRMGGGGATMGPTRSMKPSVPLPAPPPASAPAPAPRTSWEPSPSLPVPSLGPVWAWLRTLSMLRRRMMGRIDQVDVPTHGREVLRRVELDNTILRPRRATGVDIEHRVRGPYVAPDHGWESFESDADPHAWFGRELITAVWTDATRAVELRSGAPVPIEVLGAARHGVDSHRVRIMLGSNAPAWLTIDAPNTRYAVTLPGAPDAHYELSMTWDGDALVDLEVDLATSSPAPLQSPARLWAAYRSTDAAAAAEEITPADLRAAGGAVLEKVARPSSPLGAIVASLVLLHSGRREPVPIEWARNMARLPEFEDLADGVVIWAELLRRLGAGAPESPQVALAELDARDLAPVTNDGLAYALTLAELLLATLPAADPSRAAVEAVRARLGGLQRFNRPGGLFVVLAGDRDDVVRGLACRTAEAGE